MVEQFYVDDLERLVFLFKSQFVMGNSTHTTVLNIHTIPGLWTRILIFLMQ